MAQWSSLMLPPQDQKPVVDALRNATQHLATVEELLWATVWKSPTTIQRGGIMPGAKGDVDWGIKVRQVQIHLEAK